jgi:hypothetical protein
MDGHQTFSVEFLLILGSLFIKFAHLNMNLNAPGPGISSNYCLKIFYAQIYY